MYWLKLFTLFISSFGFSFTINALFIKFSQNLGIRENGNNEIRWTSTQKPTFGGITIYILFLISVAAFSIMERSDFITCNLELLGFLLATSIGFIAGLFDDAFNTKPFIKFALQLLCATIIVISNSYIKISDSNIINILLTYVWVVGIMNAINLIDNMDAIASVVVIFILLCFITIMYLNGNEDGVYVFITVGLIAAILGFLVFNWRPSKLFMGDTGSMFLGSAIAFLGIKYGWNMDIAGESPDAWIRVLSIAIIFIIPLTDTTTVFFKRISSGRSPFIGGKDHTTHHLYYLNIKEQHVALIFAFIGLISVISIFKLVYLYNNWNVFITLGCFSFVIIVFCALFYIANINKDKE